MKTIELGEVIASRELELITPDGSVTQVIVKIGKPRPFEDSSDYLAPYVITGIGKENVGYAGGVDAVQSIRLVMGMINADLKSVSERAGVVLTWIGDDSGGWGFD